MRASISLGDDLLIPYNMSQVFGDIDEKTGELYILVKNVKDPSKNIKLFFKEEDPDTIEEPEEVLTNNPPKS